MQETSSRWEAATAALLEAVGAVGVRVGVVVGLESGGLTPVDICLDSIEDAASSVYDYVLS